MTVANKPESEVFEHISTFAISLMSIGFDIRDFKVIVSASEWTALIAELRKSWPNLSPDNEFSMEGLRFVRAES